MDPPDMRTWTQSCGGEMRIIRTYSSDGEMRTIRIYHSFQIVAGLCHFLGEPIGIKIGQPAINRDQGYELPHLR